MAGTERLLIGGLVAISSFLLRVTCQDVPHTRGYFDASLPSQAEVPGILSLRNHTTFSFRTCGSGSLISQTGASGESIEVSLNSHGYMQFGWVQPQEPTRAVLIFNDTVLNTNQWYTVDINFLQGVITFSVEQGSTVLYSHILSNSTSNRFLWDLNLSGGTSVVVGFGYTGCLQQGLGILLEAAETTPVNVEWDVCPLEDALGCGLAAINPCWQYPCLNGGSCTRSGDTSYTCECPFLYTGQNCDVDLSERGCDEELCLNSGTCVPQMSGSRNFVCDCVPGFTGMHCEVEIDECFSEPCQNGGVCSDAVGMFTCDCSSTGYEGVFCQTNINECLPLSPCAGGALCMDTPGGYKCQCSLGLAGQDCEVSVDECSSSPCVNGGMCSEGVGFFSCSCPSGFTGTTCDTDIDECQEVSDPCPAPNTQCVDVINGYSCECILGFQDVAGSCAEIDECLSQPCLNGASCLNQVNSYLCQCVAGYEDSNCQTNHDDCNPDPCQNGASCRDLVNGFLCDCVAGFMDSTCSTNIDECLSNPCDNGGACLDEVLGYSCDCVAGWEGDTCQDNIDECSSSPCQNGGSCIDDVASYMCNCVPGYSGSNCEEDIDECASSPCGNGAECTDTVNEFSCVCPPEWMGVTCAQAYDACAFDPCQNSGTCSSVPPSPDFSCSCLGGFTGANCETNIDDCVGNDCPAYEVCQDGIQSYDCVCPPGFEGALCDVEINECVSSPCQNGGQCVDEIGSYSCMCPGDLVNLTQHTSNPLSVFRTGYEGLNCELEINECLYDPPICLNGGDCRNYDGSFGCLCLNFNGQYITGPFCEKVKEYCDIEEDPPACKNGGTCTSGTYSYQCTCAPGFTGTRCETNIDECAPSPCLMGGTCTDGINSYVCQCVPGLSGPNCDVNINECASEPCLNQGQCLDAINSYICNCTDTGFTGIHCDHNIDDCESSPCQNGAPCHDGIKEYNCTCYPGYTGQHCEVDIQECVSDPCQNGGECSELSEITRPGFSYDTAAGFACSCVPGFTDALCVTNIEECASSPCVHGSCEDGVNSYSCLCLPGYTGDLCQVEIDECAVHDPCKNGAGCQDLVAAYECTCVRDTLGSVYGGQNCTVELIGCQFNMCQNEALCIPVLLSEADDVHNYTCQCQPGFTGHYCDIITTLAMAGFSWLHHVNQPGTSLHDLEVTLSFRTTLPNAVLVLMVGQTEGDYLLIMLLDAYSVAVQVDTSSASGVTVLESTMELSFSDANWHHVSLNATTENILEATVTHLPYGSSTVISRTMEIPSFIIQDIYFGGTDAPLSSLGVDMVIPGFTGCMQDIQVAGSIITPAAYADQSSGIVERCPRVEQCSPDPCHGHGACQDLWHTYACHCQRPWFGNNCNESFIAATFGSGEEASYVQFSIPDEEDVTLSNQANISFFFRTRQENALLFYLGGEPSVSSSKLTYIAGRLYDGTLLIQAKLSQVADVFLYDSSLRLNDGEQHYLMVRRKDSQLYVTLNDRATVQFEVTLTLVFSADVVVVGFIPDSSSGVSRKKRQADDSLDDSLVVEPPWEAPQLEGTIQDMRLNDQSLQFFASNDTTATNLPTVVEPAVMSNVQDGEVTEDVCNISPPCENNATCENVFFNDFLCHCPDGYKGRNCSELNYCLNAQCPDNSTCMDVQDGFECVIAATFDGSSSLAQYTSPDLPENNVFTLSLQLRTRQTSGILFHMSSRSGRYITVGLDGGELQLLYQLGVEGSYSGQPSHTVVDGEWHRLELVFMSDSLNLKLDDTLSYESSSLSNSAIHELYQPGGSVYVGGVDTSYRNLYSGMFFSSQHYKGCVNEVRVQNRLLPFFGNAALGNGTSPSQFVATTLTGLQIGCHGDPVCDSDGCLNGATCVDIFNDYHCDCVLGFNGTLCEVNIDDCVGHLCDNGATCLDGINNYTCSCVPGYTGELCETEILECDSSPCQNAGVCVEGINSFECNCTANFTGSLCQFNTSDNCENHPCQNGGTCTQLNETEASEVQFNCTCQPGYKGIRCETEIDYCEGDPCLNGATCNSKTELQNYTCSCPLGFTGRNCEEEIDECASDPCENGATCNNHIGSYNCTCVAGWTGVNCEEDIDECNGMLPDGSPPCANGVCVNTDGGHHCNCTGSGFRDDQCELDINECDLDPCMHGGNCTNYNGSYICDCTLGYDGHNCENANCTHNQCDNGGTCEITPLDEWSCLCPDFIGGDVCEYVGRCADLPCGNGGTCTQPEQPSNNYTCSCTPGWTGTNCTEDKDECVLEEPCQNGATCTNTEGGYECVCAPGFTGTNCVEDINECISRPCGEHGSCQDLVNGYECVCLPGWQGTHCDEDIDECSLPSPCSNKGNCTNSPGSYECSCNHDYIGRDCHLPNPCYLPQEHCFNSGLCGYAPPSGENATAHCNCTGGWLGARCDQADPTSIPLSAGNGLLVALVVGITAAVLIILIGVIIFIMHARKERAMHGTYSPSRQEMSGSRVEMGNVMKPPPEERLI